MSVTLQHQLFQDFLHPLQHWDRDLVLDLVLLGAETLTEQAIWEGEEDGLIRESRVWLVFGVGRRPGQMASGSHCEFKLFPQAENFVEKRDNIFSKVKILDKKNRVGLWCDWNHR